jgi:hypothetical protein
MDAGEASPDATSLMNRNNYGKSPDSGRGQTSIPTFS